MLEVFSVPELVLWCSKQYDASRRIIHVGKNIIQPISLKPFVFHRILRLLESKKEFKIDEADEFIPNHGGPKRLLSYFIDSFFWSKDKFFPG